MSEEVWRESAGYIERYGYRGVIIATYCPGCSRKLLSLRQAEKAGLVIGYFFKRTAFDDVLRITDCIMRSLNPDIRGIWLFVPKRQEIAEKTGYRVVVYPICSKCDMQVRSNPEFTRKIMKTVEDSIEGAV